MKYSSLFIFFLVNTINVVNIWSQHNLTLSINTDNWGYETYWEILNSTGAVIQSAPTNSYSNNAIYNIPINNLSNGSYTLNFRDSYGDGIYVPNGYQLKKANNEIIASYSGNFGSLHSTSFTLSSSCSDVQPPSNVTLNSSNSIPPVINAPIVFTATAADNIGVTKVEFYSASQKIGELISAPYTLVWSAPSVGLKSITSKAYDACGNSTTSNSVSVTIIGYCSN